jgi:uncharacterized protein
LAKLPVHLGFPQKQREWPTQQWVDEFRSSAPDWHPTPFQQFILKIHSRCNLSCDYCYIYEMADQSWRQQPMTMATHIVEQAAQRIAEHATEHNLATVDVFFHGGEPLLAGNDMLARAATILRQALPAHTNLRLAVQTNGILLDVATLEILRAHRIQVGVSIDGDREGHDRHRRYANGRGSHEAVAAGIRLLAEDRYRHLFGGLLATVDLSNDPVATYEHLMTFGPPMVDFLLPHANWESTPPGTDANTFGTPYAHWLIPIFERWYNAGCKETQIRLFAEIINLVLGGASSSEAVGLSPAAMLVIETDGTLEQVDELKSTYPGAAETGFTLLDHSFDSVLDHPAIVARQAGASALSATCRQCPIHDICGGGHFVHRYRPGGGFRNPSVYCADLYALITHIDSRVQADLHKIRENAHVVGTN